MELFLGILCFTKCEEVKVSVKLIQCVSHVLNITRGASGTTFLIWYFSALRRDIGTTLHLSCELQTGSFLISKVQREMTFSFVTTKFTRVLENYALYMEKFFV